MMQTLQENEENSNRSIDPPRQSVDPAKMVEAAIRIQVAWRRYIDLQVFKYYKDLLVFHNEGDPALIMKYINPNEAKLIDSASGIFIKFRLAGQQFPPTIYYKIFTHRPIQDICANAPRDYTRPYLKQKSALEHNTRVRKSLPETTEGWYRRIENNGWRPVSTKHLMQMNMDFYFCDSKQLKSAEFKPSRIVRRQEKEIQRKKTKIEWMKKMYRNGMLKPNDNNPATQKLIDEAAKSLLETIDRRDGQEFNMLSVEEWEVEELLEWTNGLNFDEYYSTWKAIGTTTQSDRFAAQRRRIKNSTSRTLKNIEFERNDTFDFDDELGDFDPKPADLNSSDLAPLQASTHRHSFPVKQSSK